MIILLPPSEGKSADTGKGIFQDAHPELVGDIRPVLKRLRTLKGEAIGKFYGIKKEDKAAETHKKNLNILKSGGQCALERYTGVIYTHIDYPTLSAKKRAARRIYVVSGMFGLISAKTSIPAYKSPINTWLTNYWRGVNTQRLHDLKGRKQVLSLLPQSYAKAVGIDNALHVEFKIEGGKKLAGHFGKAIKGKFVRFLVENNIDSPQHFDAFIEDSFKFDGTNFIQK